MPVRRARSRRDDDREVELRVEGVAADVGDLGGQRRAAG